RGGFLDFSGCLLHGSSLPMPLVVPPLGGIYVPSGDDPDNAHCLSSGPQRLQAFLLARASPLRGSNF
ncbi:MAG: hypothetical protein ACREJL_02715, partial [Candidatus Methylomirabilales bacterium]